MGGRWLQLYYSDGQNYFESSYKVKMLLTIFNYLLRHCSDLQVSQ